MSYGSYGLLALHMMLLPGAANAFAVCGAGMPALALPFCFHHSLSSARSKQCGVKRLVLAKQSKEPQEPRQEVTRQEDMTEGLVLRETEEPPLSVTSKFTPEETQKIGNLVGDDEWMGLTMEITELVRVAVLENVKSNARDFLGKDGYKIGDVSKELDSRIKDEVAKLRGKDEYELGDLSVALDDMSKQLVCEMTGKETYELGDLSSELDTRVKTSVAAFCGKESYEFGDLSLEIDTRIKTRVSEFTRKDSQYQFGDISKEIEQRRSKWVSDLLEGTDYKFGDISRKFATNFTGKEAYEFGDVSKKIVDNLFGKRKRGNTKVDTKDD